MLRRLSGFPCSAAAYFFSSFIQDAFCQTSERPSYSRSCLFPCVTPNGDFVGGIGGGCHPVAVPEPTEVLEVERQRRQILRWRD